MNTLIEQIEKEYECYKYCLTTSRQYAENGDYKGAVVCLENAIRSLKELDKLKEVGPFARKVRLVGYVLGSRRSNDD